MRVKYDDDGNPCGSNCTYYAYCLMNNHFHLLIREREESVGETVKRIASSYVYYYNRKYGRDGHLFKERFKSEPVRSALPLLPCYRRDARTIWPISQYCCGIYTKIQSRQVL